MDILESIRKFVVKLQELPEHKKKIILWTIVVILAIVMGIFWIKGALGSFSRIGENLGKIEMPKMDFSDMPKVDLQGMEDLIQNSTLGDDAVIVDPGLKLISQLEDCQAWSNYKEMGYLGCLPKGTNSQLLIKNNLDKIVKINVDYFASGVKLNSVEPKKQTILNLGNQNEEVIVKISDQNSKPLSAEELNQIFYKIEQ